MLFMERRLFYDDLCPGDSFACKSTLFYLNKANNAIKSGMNCEISAHVCAGTGKFGCSGLTYQNFTAANTLATKTFGAKSLTGTVSIVFAGTASFDM